MSRKLGMKLTGVALAATLASALAVPVAYATPITVNVDTVLSGQTNTPDGSAPWLTASFEATSSTTGTLTLTSNLTAPDVLQGANGVMGWAFNLAEAPTAFSCPSGTCADTVSLSGINMSPYHDALNLGFGWTSKNRFGAGDSAVYDLTFNTLPNDLSNFFEATVAHVQSLSNGQSTFIVNGTPPVGVPEPSSLGMLGLGLAGLGLIGWTRRRHQTHAG